MKNFPECYRYLQCKFFASHFQALITARSDMTWQLGKQLFPHSRYLENVCHQSQCLLQNFLKSPSCQSNLIVGHFWSSIHEILWRLFLQQLSNFNSKSQIVSMTWPLHSQKKLNITISVTTEYGILLVTINSGGRMIRK